MAVRLDKSGVHKVPQIVTFGGLEVIQAFLRIETTGRRGEELVRLISDTSDGGKWKAFTLFTTLNELKGHEERIYNRRPTRLDRNRDEGGMTWKDRLLAQQNFEDDRQPTILMVGRPPDMYL